MGIFFKKIFKLPHKINKISLSKMSVASLEDLKKIDAQLANSGYLSGSDKPNEKDSEVLLALRKKEGWVPNYDETPNLFSYVCFFADFTDEVIASWKSAPKQE